MKIALEICNLYRIAPNTHTQHMQPSAGLKRTTPRPKTYYKYGEENRCASVGCTSRYWSRGYYKFYSYIGTSKYTEKVKIVR